MPILFRCNRCQQKLSVSTRKAGTTIRCPKCERHIIVPIPEAKLVTEEDERRPLLPKGKKTKPAASDPRTARFGSGGRTVRGGKGLGTDAGDSRTAPADPGGDGSRTAARRTADPLEPPPRPERIFPRRPGRQTRRKKSSRCGSRKPNWRRWI